MSKLRQFAFVVGTFKIGTLKKPASKRDIPQIIIFLHYFLFSYPLHLSYEEMETRWDPDSDPDMDPS